MAVTFHQDTKLLKLQETIVATLDCEGFFLDINSNFYPRELAVKSSLFHAVFSFRTSLDSKKFTSYEKKRITSQETFSHGLRLHPHSPDGGADAFLITIRTIQRLLPRGFFGINNFQLQKILSKLNIPFVVLEDFKHKREVDFSLCTVHSQDMSPKASTFRCAYLHALQMWEHIHPPTKEEKLVDLTEETIQEQEKELMEWLDIPD